MPDTHAPMLQMLWEEQDAGEALRTRFGFDTGHAAVRWVAGTLAEHWGLRVQSCERIVMSDRNALAWLGTPSGRLLAKWSVAPTRFPRLAALGRLTAWLSGRRLPVWAPIGALDGRLQVEADGASMCLQHVVVGDHLDTTDPLQIRASGATLARLHDALACYPYADPALAPDGSHSVLADRITGWIDSDARTGPAPAREKLRRLTADAPPGPLPRQLVHGDFRSANVLCAGPDVVAVIDFEEARFDHPIVELARSAVLLGTRFRSWGPVTADVRAGFLDGYQSVRPLTDVEARWWDVLVLWFSLAMIPPGEDPTGWGPAALSLLPDLGEGSDLRILT